MILSETYNIRLKDLKEGQHSYRFVLDKDFFEKYANDIFSKGNIICDVTIEKHHVLLTLEFGMKGYVNVPCDRCAAPIELPVEGDFRLVLKYKGEASPADIQDMENEGIVMIPEDIVDFEMQNYLRDFSLLMVPPRLVYACREKEPIPCDDVVLDRIGFFEAETEMEEPQNSTWDALKDIQWD